MERTCIRCHRPLGRELASCTYCGEFNGAVDPDVPDRDPEPPRLEQLTSRQAVEDAHVVERGFRLWWQDHGGLLHRDEPDADRLMSGVAFRAGFDLARQLFLRETPIG